VGIVIKKVRKTVGVALGALLLGVIPGSIAGVLTSGGVRSAAPTSPTVWQPPTPSSSPGPAIADPWETRRTETAPDTRACARETLIGVAAVGRVVARVSPRVRATAVARFDRKSVFGSPQVFLLEKEVESRGGKLWFKALLPVRPNGTHGFIRAADLTVRRTHYRLEVNLSGFRLRLFEGCDLLKTYRVGVGTGGTPTPLGSFYINTLLKPRDPGTIYGTYAYGLSAYSNVLTYWKDGGFIGLHGTNQPSSIGRRSSHGCIRMLNRDIEQLVKILPLGTPITIG
jgi:hypothetical protein